MNRRINAMLEEIRHELSEAEMGSAAFMDAVRGQTKLKGKYLNLNNYNQFSQTYDTVHITFINLPADASDLRSATAMNNRYQITVAGFGKESGSAPPPKGKVKAKELTGAYYAKQVGVGKMRGKTAKPAAIAKYIAAFLSKLAATETRS